MDTLAPATLVFRRRSSLERVALDPALEIGAGGEAVVYEVPGHPGLVAKIYHQAGIERARKLTLMLANPPRMPEGTSIAWPVDLLVRPDGFAGFLMRRAQGPRLFEFYNPVTRRATAPAFHYGLLHRAGHNLAEAFHALHAAGYVVGDVNESNLLVHPRTAAVTLVDADSFQVRDQEAGAVFRSRVGKAEFTPPELQGVSFNDVDRAPEHDRFGLAVLLFLLLMEGTHPFAVRMQPGGDALPVEERIRRGLFPHASESDEVHPPRLSPPADLLDPGLRALFIRCFVDGHADPAARPTPAEWVRALETAEAALAQCARNPLHRHPPHLSRCPWCERTRLLRGRDPFPAAAAHAPVQVQPRPRRPRVAAPLAAPVSTAAARAGQAPRSGQPAQVAPPGSSLAAALGPSGLGSPAALVLPALILWVGTHGFVSFLALVVFLNCLVALVRTGWKNVTGTSLGGAVALSLMVLMAMRVTGSAANGDHGHSVLRDLPAADPAYQAPPPAAPVWSYDAGAWEDGIPGIRSLDDLLLADLVAAPPARLSDPGTPPEPGHPGPLADGYRVDRLPVLDNPDEAARTLAWFHTAAPTPGATRANAVLWLHVAADGHVTADGRRLIRSTSRQVADAAIFTVPYLRFRPAIKDGQPVDVWVAQRMVIEP